MWDLRYSTNTMVLLCMFVEEIPKLHYHCFTHVNVGNNYGLGLIWRMNIADINLSQTPTMIVMQLLLCFYTCNETQSCRLLPIATYKYLICWPQFLSSYWSMQISKCVIFRIKLSMITPYWKTVLVKYKYGSISVIMFCISGAYTYLYETYIVLTHEIVFAHACTKWLYS